MNAFDDPQATIEYFEAIRWAGEVTCPHCNHDKTYALTRKNKYRCAKCLQNISVTVRTVFEHTILPLRVWLGMIWLITNRTNGVGSDDLARALGITQKSAWLTLQRLRHAVVTPSFNKPLLRRAKRKSAKPLAIAGTTKSPKASRRAKIGSSDEARLLMRSSGKAGVITSKRRVERLKLRTVRQAGNGPEPGS
jgi:transposase-like protein